MTNLVPRRPPANHGISRLRAQRHRGLRDRDIADTSSYIRTELGTGMFGRFAMRGSSAKQGPATR